MIKFPNIEQDNIWVDFRHNIPRIDYTGGEGHWLFEPQSTNLFLNSEPTTNEGTSGNITYDTLIVTLIDMMKYDSAIIEDKRVNIANEIIENLDIDDAEINTED